MPPEGCPGVTVLERAQSDPAISTAKGIQATAGIGRSSSNGGMSMLLNNLERPTPSPIAIASAFAIPVAFLSFRLSHWLLLSERHRSR
jgi:hypothetical protein